MEIKCPYCGSEDVAVARDMIATRKCSSCWSTWTPDDEVKLDLAYTVYIAKSRKITRDYSKDDQLLEEISRRHNLDPLIASIRKARREAEKETHGPTEN